MNQVASDTLTFKYRPNFKESLYFMSFTGLLGLVDILIIRSGEAPRGGAIEGATAVFIYASAAFFVSVSLALAFNVVLSVRSKTVVTLGPDAITASKRPGWGPLVSAPYGAITSTRTLYSRGARAYVISTPERRIFLDSSGLGGFAVFDQVVAELDRRIAAARPGSA